MTAIRLIGLMSAALSVGSSAIAQQPAPALAPATVPTILGFGDADKTCLAWTDSCRTCLREADGKVVCSNIGIACQPAEIRCTAREPAK